MLPLEWTIMWAPIAGWFVAMLMNRGEFDGHYFLAAMSGPLLFPFVAAFVAQHAFAREMGAAAFAGLQPRCAGAFIACLLFDAAKRLSWR